MLTAQQKQLLKQQLVSSLKTEIEVCRILVFGSFVSSDNPHDMDVAVFQNSNEKYLPSKYPIGGVLPDFEPDMQTCVQCLAVAERVRGSITGLLSKGGR